MSATDPQGPHQDYPPGDIPPGFNGTPHSLAPPPEPDAAAVAPPVHEATRGGYFLVLAANLVPLYGVLFEGWTVFSLVFLYWFENVIVGVCNVIKMLTNANNSAFDSLAGKAFFVPFFSMHYGIFTLVHGLFVFVMFAPVGQGAFGVFAAKSSVVLNGSAFSRIGAELSGLWLPILALTVVHVRDLISEYWGRGEYRTTTLSTLMFQPYGRIVVLHLTILIGGGIAAALGQPIAALVILLGLKVAIESVLYFNPLRGTIPGQALSMTINGRKVTIGDGRTKSRRKR